MKKTRLFTQCSALSVKWFCLAFGLAAHAETMTLELSRVPEAIQPEAQAGAIEIEGDKLELYLDRKMRAEGNASIRKGAQHVQGDVIEYDVENDELKVTGNASVQANDTQISGPALKMRLSESIGEMRDASIKVNKALKPTDGLKLRNDPMVYTQSKLLNSQTSLTDNPRLYQENYRDLARPIGQASLEGSLETSRGDAKAIFFEGEDKKRLKTARYTTCAAGVDDWYIKASEIELDDYTQSGEAKNARIEFKGVPILYTPWMSFSFNKERKSGLLAPIIGQTSRSGFETTLPYYINIAPDKDATIAGRYLSKRGLLAQGEFRYLGESYSGIDSLEYLSKDNLTDEKRYYANFGHSHSFGNGWSAGFNYEKVSDDRYFSEMSTRIISTSRVNLPQEGRVDYVSDYWRFNGLYQKYQNLDDTNYPYERLPQLTLTGERHGRLFDSNLFTQWAYFDRDDRAAITPTGSRLVFNPSVSMPLENAYSFITPKIGVHSSLYNLKDNQVTIGGVTREDNQQTRTLPVLSLDSGLFFERNMNVVKNEYTQTIEPRLYYVYIPDKKQNQIPIFDTSLADLNLTSLFTENQFTGSDRVNNANQVSMAVTSRLIDNNSGYERLAATIGQRYYFDDQNTTLPSGTPSKSNSSDIIAGLTAQLANKWNLDVFWQYNTGGDGMVRNNILARYNPEPGKLLNLSYRFTQDLLEQVNASGQWPLGRGWYGVARMNYSLRESAMIESLAGLEYDAGCWQARGVMQRVETATAKANYGLFFQLELGGLASIGANPLNLLRRDIPGYLGASEIPNIYRQQNLTK